MVRFCLPYLPFFLLPSTAFFSSGSGELPCLACNCLNILKIRSHDSSLNYTQPDLPCPVYMITHFNSIIGCQKSEDKGGEFSQKGERAR